jgi:hypothetical protein
VIVIDRLLVGGIGWVLRRVADAVNSETYDESSLREELLAAEMRLELGEIDDAEFHAIEEDVLRRMRETGHRRGAAPTPGTGTRYAVEAIEADVGAELGGKREPAARGARKRSRVRSP